jgi:heptose I phosphotransferase
MIAGLFQRLIRGSSTFRHEPDWDRAAGVGWQDRIMSIAVTDRFHAKQGRSIGRCRLRSEDDELTVYLKRHYVLPRWRGVLASLTPFRAWSPGMQEWQHLAWAKSQGLPVPRAVAAGEWVGPWGRLRGFLAVEELSGMIPLHEAIPTACRSLAPVAFARWKRGLVTEMVRLTRALHDRHRFHKDLYFCHFYVPERLTKFVPETWQGQLVVIDLHRLSRHRWTSALWLVKDLAQLLYSSEVEGVTARDRLRFWRAYRGRRRWDWLDVVVRWKGRRYRGHNRKRLMVARQAA